MNAIELHMEGEAMDDGTHRLTLVISGLVSEAQMTRIALWVRSSLKENVDKIGIADPTASQLKMRQPS